MGNTCKTGHESDPSQHPPSANVNANANTNTDANTEANIHEETTTTTSTTAPVEKPEITAAVTTSVEITDGETVELHPVTKEPLKFFTIKEIEGFDDEECCYICIEGYVYDVTPFLDIHPGGSHYLLDHSGGMDATQAFKDSLHSESAGMMKTEYLVGKIKPGEKFH